MVTGAHCEKEKVQVQIDEQDLETSAKHSSTRVPLFQAMQNQTSV